MFEIAILSALRRRTSGRNGRLMSWISPLETKKMRLSISLQILVIVKMKCQYYYDMCELIWIYRYWCLLRDYIWWAALWRSSRALPHIVKNACSVLKRRICKRGKADHQFNAVPVVSFASTTGLLLSLYMQQASEQGRHYYLEILLFLVTWGSVGRGPTVVRFDPRVLKIQNVVCFLRGYISPIYSRCSENSSTGKLKLIYETFL